MYHHSLFDSREVDEIFNMKVDIIQCDSCNDQYIVEEQLVKEHLYCTKCHSVLIMYRLGEDILLTDTDKDILKNKGKIKLTNSRILRYNIK